MRGPTQGRDAAGNFTTGERQRRKRFLPKSEFIGAVFLEPTSFGAATTPGTSAFFSTPRCSVHGGTRCRTWRIRAPALGWSDNALLTTNVLVRAAFWMLPNEVYVLSNPILIPSAYVSTVEAWDSLRFVARSRAPMSRGAATGSFRSSYRNVQDGEEMTDEDLKVTLK